MIPDRILVSQYTASLYGVAGKRGLAESARRTWVVSGYLGGKTVWAFEDGHHAYLASIMQGVTPVFVFTRAFGPDEEPEFIAWLRDNTKEGPWFDLATGRLVLEALPTTEAVGSFWQRQWKTA